MASLSASRQVVCLLQAGTQESPTAVTTLVLLPALMKGMQLLLPSVLTTAASHAVLTYDWAQSTPGVVLKQVHLAETRPSLMSATGESVQTWHCR